LAEVVVVVASRDPETPQDPEVVLGSLDKGLMELLEPTLTPTLPVVVVDQVEEALHDLEHHQDPISTAPT
jgi:hypothetical protein